MEMKLEVFLMKNLGIAIVSQNIKVRNGPVRSINFSYPGVRHSLGRLESQLVLRPLVRAALGSPKMLRTKSLSSGVSELN